MSEMSKIVDLLIKSSFLIGFSIGLLCGFYFAVWMEVKP